MQLTPEDHKIERGGRRRLYAGRLDPLRPVPRIWARPIISPNDRWHRIAWQRHEGDHAELVGLCGQAFRMVATEQGASHVAPGRRCAECAIALEQAMTSRVRRIGA